MYKYVKDTHFGYNPNVDKMKVDPSGMIDVRKAYASGTIDGNVIIEDSAFNGVIDPADIMERPKDMFERIRQANYVKESLRAARANAEAGHPEGESK